MENKQQTTALAKSGKSELAVLLESRKEALAQVLPKHITADRMTKVALLCVNENALLKKCTPASVFTAVMQSAETGLELGSAMGHAYLVPYYNGQEKRYEAKFIPGYKGLLDLVRRSGLVKDVQVELRYEKDGWEREGGLEPKFRHVPFEGAERGKEKGAYCIIRFKDGGTQATYMTTAEINAIRDGVLAKQKNVAKSPWTTNWGEMAKKTVVRRACKTAPVSREVAVALSQMDEADTKKLDVGALDTLDFAMPQDEQPDEAPAHDAETGEVVEGELVQPEEDKKPAAAAPPQVSVALKKALESIEKAKKEGDKKRLADSAAFIKEALQGEEHTVALNAYKAAKAELDAKTAKIEQALNNEPPAEG